MTRTEPARRVARASSWRAAGSAPAPSGSASLPAAPFVFLPEEAEAQRVPARRAAGTAQGRTYDGRFDTIREKKTKSVRSQTAAYRAASGSGPGAEGAPRSRLVSRSAAAAQG